MSGSGMLDISLEYCFFLHVDAVKFLHETDGILIDLGRSKYDGILQEINARMILYNFCELVTSHMVKHLTKHVYKINAVNICRAYMTILYKILTPVRYNESVQSDFHRVA